MMDAKPKSNKPSALIVAAALVTVLTAGAAGTSGRDASAPPERIGPADVRRESPLGVFDGHGDIGAVDLPGSVLYDAQKQEYVAAGSGLNMWFASDEGHFLWKRLKGDFILSARVAFLGEGGAAHRKIGWMVRSSLDPDSAHVSAVVHGDGLTSAQYRKARGEQTLEDEIGVTGPNQVQLERRGGTYIMSVAHFGEAYIRDIVEGVALGNEVFAGLFVCAHKADTLERARFSNVRIVIPPKDDFVPYRDSIGSRLEVLDVASRDRLVLDESPRDRQAPNWTRDGRALIYNADGRLFRFDLAARTSAAIDTGPVTLNNNDHVLSFNGRMLGLSSQFPNEAGVSIIYTVPVGGGRPVRVTSRGPSYLHGWSPDGRTLVYTGARNGNFDVYKISVRGGKETRLTRARGLDDGPEFTPDGRFIYFCSNRRDGMRIWRMLANGKLQRQVTSDGFQDWFPHVSPDGRWIVFLSYDRDVDPGDHPFYKQVNLRLMPVTGGEARVIAYIFGGQGTINVPSWSPDGKKIAFFSYSDGIR
ncbi:MAG TPA: hypothetical protein VEG35_05430 [Burkholderiales bacterium]|nr:hypothetical protein [Burkholderiales bacterium]